MKVTTVVLVLVMALASTAEGKIKCPPAPFISHASCKEEVTFSDSCDAVRSEISARVNGQYSAWHDPHNNGTYTFTDNSTETEWSLERLTGDGKYTDKILFTFTDSGSGCFVTACSESQVFSILDYGTNYCNMHDLYCSDKECYPFTMLTYTESVKSCTDDDVNKCYLA